ncbi:hypothetical protein L3X38_009903 [Prunus dulcis]|uniref:Uncharacterized protein n=1 Tax=Prunus dulcis TaxID=3755 RepID=A0AAD4WFF0_PRUDU|nr:hypothetical protein L3X38_009903 [Prunus dulcis]
MIRHLLSAPLHYSARTMSLHLPSDSASTFGPKLTAVSLLSFPSLRQQLLSQRHAPKSAIVLPSLRQQLLKLTVATPASTLRHQFAKTCVAKRHPTGRAGNGSCSVGFVSCRDNKRVKNAQPEPNPFNKRVVSGSGCLLSCGF